MRVLLDTNVVLDLLLDRRPFAEDAAAIFGMVERGDITGLLCATTVTTVDYLLTTSLPADQVRPAIRSLLALFEVAAVGRGVLQAAADSRMADFEDAVLAMSAQGAGADRIVTRNTQDFRGAPVPAISPKEFLAACVPEDRGDASGGPP